MGLPLAVYRCGLLLGTVMLFMGGYTCAIYYKIIVQAADVTQEKTYVRVVEQLYGKVWSSLLQVFLIVYSIGMLCSYQAMIGQLLNSVFHSIGVFFTPTGEVHRLIIICGINLFVLFPLSLLRQLSSLRYAAVISVISAFYIAAVILLQTPAYLYEKQEVWSHLKWVNLDHHVLDAICITLFALEATRGVPIVYSEMKNRSPERMGKVINSVVVLTLALYTCIGVFGYLSHIDNMPQLIVFRPPLENSRSTD